MKLLITTLVLLAGTARAQLLQPGLTIDQVLNELKGKYQISDSISFEEQDVEGQWGVEHIRFAPYELGGIQGYLYTTYNRAGRLVAVGFRRDDAVLFGETSMSFSLGDPRRDILDSLKFGGDGTVAQLTSLVKTYGKSWGKPLKTVTDEKVEYFWKTGKLVHLASLRQGDIAIGWAKLK